MAAARRDTDTRAPADTNRTRSPAAARRRAPAAALPGHEARGSSWLRCLRCAISQRTGAQGPPHAAGTASGGTPARLPTRGALRPEAERNAKRPRPATEHSLEPTLVSCSAANACSSYLGKGEGGGTEVRGKEVGESTGRGEGGGEMCLYLFG